MTLNLDRKHIILGVTGSIAAFKSADLTRRLREAGAIVRVVMTENAKRFITPLTMQALSGFPIHDDLFDLQAEAAMGHIELARWADLILIAPATADTMARIAHGTASDLLTTLCLATLAPLMIAPAMNQRMWLSAPTQNNLQILQANQVHLLQPDQGSQACGDVGPGRMMEPHAIVDAVANLFKTGKLQGQRVLITAGPTVEAIDPIRFISNSSSGKMGYALAAAAHAAGAKVTLISGPVTLNPPEGVDIIPVKSAQEMYAAVMTRATTCHLFIGVAAVGDYRSEAIATQKIHKTDASMQLTLHRNPDIITAVSQLKPRPFVVGFAAETEDVVNQASAKRVRKQMDIIIANRVGEKVGLGSDDNEVTVIDAHEHVAFPRMPKEKLARQLIELIAHRYQARPIV
ncbi:MAG: bifunctional phosphopantothenoylcysteine decarboxylase/phosphopantothenate--cysteine ligase CoaBC [Gammaproteobacteria bacterium]|nr:bifunctional phosphopantothenoylcysteine decarboxylase/phosphopantothenate--cysteine ligase CoaBC [Gammaproteobacteria bacterium]